jgi:Spy/CpxP family protein refolding chaperone
MAMTTFRLFRAGAAALALGAAAFMWTAPAAARPQSTMQRHDNAQQRAQFQQNVNQQQLGNQLRDNRIGEQQRQQISDNSKRPYANDASTTRQIEQADQAHRDRYDSQQQNALDSYESAVTPRPVPQHSSSRGDNDKSSDGG